MKFTLPLLIFYLIVILFMGGCFVYWTDDALILTCLKDYDLKEKTSTVHPLKVELSAKPIPRMEIEIGE